MTPIEMHASERRKLLRRASRMEETAVDIRLKYGIHWKASTGLRHHGKAGIVVARLIDRAHAIRMAVRDRDFEIQKMKTEAALKRASQWKVSRDGRMVRVSASTAPKTRPSLSAGLRRRILERDRFRCVDCGRRSPDVELHVDHRISRKDGGTDDPGNLATTCSDCNLGKGARSVVGWTRQEHSA